MSTTTKVGAGRDHKCSYDCRGRSIETGTATAQNQLSSDSNAALAECGVSLIQGDSEIKMREMAENSVDAVVTDPPYGLTEKLDIEELLACWLTGTAKVKTSRGFMENEWDGCVPAPTLWREALRVLKPGGHCLAFAGSRTADLTTLSLRLAGFEIRDVLVWHYGQGMPKSKNIGRELGYSSKNAVGSALKPSYEPIIIARKPLAPRSGLASNVEMWGTGGLNIDASRVRAVSDDGRSRSGRWPSNTLLSHTQSCRVRGRGRGRSWSCASSCPVAVVDEQRSNQPSRFFQAFAPEREPERCVESPAIEAVLRHEAPNFLFCPKPTKQEREAGLSAAGFTAKRGQSLTYGKRAEVARYRLNTHNTVKPVTVMQWLIELVCPADGLVLDPFNGSGTTGCAAVQARRHYVGIELDKTEGYLGISAARIIHVAKMRSAHALAA